ncbi:Gag-Pro-Pol polyprotein [Diplonema papillatum]|nr:Gag-Pro-Pol polyprotein [Diplonema papillatum]KAJ9437984.1 Gag-Pro-Pol polyprotein [Diplonema papillatum]KAJ9440044.1 Gag-Pro-Pol polyprotein [Diplonema papillatum]KAJ9440748.1 Gag-Pro-Pol polyprotein [Diplonema papillatum]KAJ9445902.1 Gag-Pro-Pol polyprotein [Diplonema papillatum]
MKWSREAAVEWVKRATGLQVPSAFHFRPDNGRLRPIIRLAGDAGASADAYLRSLLGALGGEEPPSGTAQWVLAWLACASAPTATPADFEELVRSVSPAHHEGPSPRLPGRSADAAHSDSADYAAFSAAASTAATSAAAAAADPSAASYSAAAPIGENRWVTRVGTRGGQSIRLWSDASSKEWAALLEGEPDRVSQGIFFGHFAEKHIFLKELFAVLKGLELAVRTHRGVSVELMVDNLPAVHCLNKGHSKNYAANIVLSRIFDLAREYGLELTAAWVPTHEQRADEYTRGTQAKENATPGGWLPKEEDLSPPPDLTT